MPLGLIGEFRHIFTHKTKIQVYILYTVYNRKKDTILIFPIPKFKSIPPSLLFPPKRTRVFTTPHFDNKGRGFTTKMKVTSSKSSKQNHETANFRRPFWERKSFPSIRWGFVSITIRLSTRTGAAFFFWVWKPPRGVGNGWFCWVSWMGLDFMKVKMRTGVFFF